MHYLSINTSSKRVLLVLACLLLQSCLSFEAEIRFADRRSGTVSFRYTFRPSVLKAIGLSDSSEPLFPWTRRDYELVSELYDGVALDDLQFEMHSSDLREVFVRYAFSDIESLNQLLHDLGMNVEVQRRASRYRVFLRGRSLPTEVPLDSSVEMRETENAGFTVQIMRLLFPEMATRYTIAAPSAVTSTSRGYREGAHAVLEGTLSELADNLYDFEWIVAW